MKCVNSCCPLLPLHKSVAQVYVGVFFIFAVSILVVIISKCHGGCPPYVGFGKRASLFIALQFAVSEQEPTTSTSRVVAHLLLKWGLLGWLLHER